MKLMAFCGITKIGCSLLLLLTRNITSILLLILPFAFCAAHFELQVEHTRLGILRKTFKIRCDIFFVKLKCLTLLYKHCNFTWKLLYFFTFYSPKRRCFNDLTEKSSFGYGYRCLTKNIQMSKMANNSWKFVYI